MHDAWPYILPAVSSLLGGGLIVGLYRIRPERQNLLANASERAVASLIAALDDMEGRLDEAARRELELQEALTEHRAELTKVRAELHKTRAAFAALQLERDAWKQRALDAGWRQDSPSPMDQDSDD